MTNKTPINPQWDVLVTLNATVSAWIKVEATSQEEAGDVATHNKTVLENSNAFELDESNFHSWASDAYLPDPDDGIVPHSSESPLGVILSDITPTKTAIMNSASKGYNTHGYSVDLRDQSGPDVVGDGLALFITKELKDVMRNTKDEYCKREAIVAMESAIEELRSVISHIENL